MHGHVSPTAWCDCRPVPPTNRSTDGLTHHHPPPPPTPCDRPANYVPQDPSFKLRLKSGITMVSENGVKVRVERDTEYATMKA